MPTAEHTKIDPSGRLPSGKHGLAPEAVARSQRQRILRAMITAAAERGYSELRVVDVIKQAGVSRKTFYELFDDKQECFLAAYDFVIGQLYAGTAAAYETAEGSWPEKVRAGLGRMLEELSANPDGARFAVIEVLAAGPKAVTRRDAAMRQFTEFIDAGRSESKLDLPGITSLAIVGGIYELIYSEILHGAAAQLPSRLPEIVYWVTQPFLGTERADAERAATRAALAESAEQAA